MDAVQVTELDLLFRIYVTVGYSNMFQHVPTVRRIISIYIEFIIHKIRRIYCMLIRCLFPSPRPTSEHIEHFPACPFRARSVLRAVPVRREYNI